MYATLDLTWKPTADESEPSNGKWNAIVRNDTYPLPVVITDGVVNGFDDGEFSAQIRTERVSGSSASEPSAEFEVDVAVDGDDLSLVLSLSSEVTSGLPTDPLFWDLQVDLGGDVTTLLAGRVKVLDDVTRAA